MSMAMKYSNIPDLWGGIECSFNRVADNFFDQLLYCNHYERVEDDLRRIADLGITAIRYPLLWERHQPACHQSIDWTMAGNALELLQEQGISPIVGLVHHGSGPRYADITSSEFAPGLAGYAAKVAEKFPWLNYYTPINEPLTTARFAGLYGIWYPHKRDDRAFVTLLLNQLKGVVLAMKEIRKINPDAKLVQTEDLAKVYGTPCMAYQAGFENHRRWLTFDILSGSLRPGHALWEYFISHTANEDDLFFFHENRCPADILGLDYYPTSERYLDEALDRYPAEKHGYNLRHHYADVEAIRVRHDEPSGIRALLMEAWSRYQSPMAVTEVHINCDYDNQIRWFSEIRDPCIDLKAQGVNILAVTTWAMLGSYGWNALLTEPEGDYESGAFDVSSGEAIRTPLGDYIRRLSREPDYRHPALNEKGWWHEDNRFLFEWNSPAELSSRDQPVNKEILEHKIE